MFPKIHLARLPVVMMLSRPFLWRLFVRVFFFFLLLVLSIRPNFFRFQALCHGLFFSFLVVEKLRQFRCLLLTGTHTKTIPEILFHPYNQIRVCLFCPRMLIKCNLTNKDRLWLVVSCLMHLRWCNRRFRSLQLRCRVVLQLHHC